MGKKEEPLSCWAIDPGSEKSAVVVYDGAILDYFEMSNAPLVRRLEEARVGGAMLVIEQIVNYGQIVGDDVFSTVFWSGRIAQAWRGPFELMPRRVVKKHLRAKNDSKVRFALMARFGEPPGLISHMWQALGLAVTYWDRRSISPS